MRLLFSFGFLTLSMTMQPCHLNAVPLLIASGAALYLLTYGAICISLNSQAILGCRPSDSSDFGLQTIKLKRFWVADRQTQAILCYRPSNSSNFGLQTIKLKRFWVADHQAQAILGCRPSSPGDFGLQTVQLKRFWFADHHPQAILG